MKFFAALLAALVAVAAAYPKYVWPKISSKIIPHRR